MSELRGTLGMIRLGGLSDFYQSVKERDGTRWVVVSSVGLHTTVGFLNTLRALAYGEKDWDIEGAVVLAPLIREREYINIQFIPVDGPGLIAGTSEVVRRCDELQELGPVDEIYAGRYRLDAKELREG